MNKIRYAYKRIPSAFAALLSDTARAVIRQAVAESDVDWYTVAAEIFDLGTAAWLAQRAEQKTESAEAANA